MTDKTYQNSMCGMSVWMPWLSPKAHTPEEGTEVLVTIENASGKREAYLAFVVDGEWRGVSSDEKVVAWMPLPEPYMGA